LETIGMRGSANDRPLTTSANRSSIGSIRDEWKAWETRRRVVRRPWSAKRAASRATAASSPEITVADGPFTAAMPTRSPVSASSTSSRAASLSLASTATMAPPAGRPRISEARAATRAAASGSESTPETWAAMISPSEWPMR
jgi:hypothetical protein